MNKTIKVLIPTVYPSHVAAIRSRLYPLFLVLAKEGFECTFLVLKDKDIQYTKYNKTHKGIKYETYDSYIGLIKKLVLLNRSKYDIVYSCKQYSLSALLPYIVSRLKGLPYVLDVDDSLFIARKKFRFFLYTQEWLAQRLMMFLSPQVTVASKQLITMWGKIVHYIPNSTDLEVFYKNPALPNIIKERFQIEDTVIVWVAIFLYNLIDRDYPIDIFKELQGKGAKITLLVVGDGEELSYIKNKVKRLGLTNVVFTGQVSFEELLQIYTYADAGLLPLRDKLYDSCKGPIKLYEYMAMELPVIATPVGEAKHTITKANCGVFIPLYAPTKAASIIIDLFSIPNRACEIGKMGRKYIETKNSFTKNALMLKNALLYALKK
ncbi:MAG: glycosyltransferase [Candidatus Magnetoovum sp. WYHC-5]|nr:glycosyltransferase [Candidatus Magnetoovum sp. WYHC-5]